MNSTSTRVIENQRRLFDIPDKVAYLNCAYMSPLMHSVVQAGEAGARRKQQPWKIAPPDFFELPRRGRELFGEIVGATGDSIAVIPSVSYGIGVAANNVTVPAGGEILLLQDQFPSNVYPWREKARVSNGHILTLPRPAPGQPWTGQIIDAIGPETAVVALPQVHWTDGSLLDLVAIGQAARAAGAALVIDATQSAGAMPIDLGAIQPDFLVSGTYKWLLGPYSLGFMYVAPQHQDGQPLEQAWAGRKGSENFARLVDYQDEYASGARRMDMGECTQFHLMPMAIRAMEQILEWGIDSIASTLLQKTRDIARRAESIGLGSVPENLRAGHYMGLAFPGGVPSDLLDRLAQKNVYVSVRGDSVRVTPHLYNTGEDIERLFEVLRSVVG